MLLNFTNGIDEISVKTGGEWYPFFLLGLLFFPLLFLIACYFAFKKKQFSLTIINSLIIYVAMTFITALVFTFSDQYVANTFDISLLFDSVPTMLTLLFFVILYIFTTIVLMRHVGDYHANQLVKKGFYLVDPSHEQIAEVERCAEVKKPFWLFDN